MRLLFPSATGRDATAGDGVYSGSYTAPHGVHQITVRGVVHHDENLPTEQTVTVVGVANNTAHPVPHEWIPVDGGVPLTQPSGSGSAQSVRGAVAPKGWLKRVGRALSK